MGLASTIAKTDNQIQLTKILKINRIKPSPHGILSPILKSDLIITQI